MAIYCVWGRPRHGKTAWLISHIPAWLKEARAFNMKIYSNVYLNLDTLKFITKKWGFKKPNDIVGDIYSENDRKNPDKLIFYWRNIDEWKFMEHGTIIADEGTRYFNARSWASLSPDTTIKLQQHGKEDLDIWLTTQHWTRLDAEVRPLIENYYHVQRTFGFGNSTIFCRVVEHYLEELTRYENQILNNPNAELPEDVWSENFWIRKKWKILYDTKQKVAQSRPMPFRHIERFCENPNCDRHNKPHISHE